MKKLPGDTHIKNMHPDLKKYVIQNLSMYKGNGKMILLLVYKINVHISCNKLPSTPYVMTIWSLSKSFEWN